MSYVTTTFPPRTVTAAVRPVSAERGATYLALGAIKPTPWLRDYPNGRRLTSLGGYEKKSFLQTYVNGRPLESIGGSTPKQALVVMALNNAMAKKCGRTGAGGQAGSRRRPTMNQYKRQGMRGLGDDGATMDDSAEASVDSNDETYTPISPEYGTAGYDTSGNPITVPSSSGSPIPAMSSIPGVGPVTSPSTGNVLTNLLNSLLGGTASPYGTAYPYGLGTGLSSPLYAGASISTGGALMIGAVVLGVVLLTKKR